MKAQELKNQLEELEKKLKEIGSKSLNLLSHHHAHFSKDEEWEMAVNVNHDTHEVYDKIKEIRKSL